MASEKKISPIADIPDGTEISLENLLEIKGGLASPLRDRMTVVDKVYHQPMKGGDAFCCETTFDRWLNSEESVYSRKMKVGNEWKKLHLGWFTDEGKPIGMLVIRNDEGKHLQVNLSDEEKTELAKKVLEVGTVIRPHRLDGVAADVLHTTCVNPDVSGQLTEAVKEILKKWLPQSITLFYVHPGEAMRGSPSGVELYVRCLNGDCSFTVFAFPG